MVCVRMTVQRKTGEFFTARLDVLGVVSHGSDNLHTETTEALLRFVKGLAPNDWRIRLSILDPTVGLEPFGLI